MIYSTVSSGDHNGLSMAMWTLVAAATAMLCAAAIDASRASSIVYDPAVTDFVTVLAAESVGFSRTTASRASSVDADAVDIAALVANMVCLCLSV